MPSLANLANKELRFALLSMFPSADLKLVSEAAKCGDLDVAADFLRTALAETGAPDRQPLAEATAEVKPPPTDSAPSSIPQQRVSDEGKRVLEERAQQPVEETFEEALAAAEKEDLALKLEKSRAEEERKEAAKGYAPVGGAITADGWEIRCQVNTERTCQSLRTLQYPTAQLCTAAPKILENVGQDNTAAFAAVCFERMLQREQDLDKDFCVFYHHYNSASLLYEVQTELARFAFALPDNFAPLPRVLAGHFRGATLSKLKESAVQHQDHDPWFRCLGLSASPTLFAFGSEAPPLHCFRHGYGCEDLSFQGLLTGLLKEACDLKQEAAEKLTLQLAEVGASFGLQVAGYGYNAKGSSVRRMGGQMLQIFIRKKYVPDYVYHSEPYGIPINTEVLPWLESPQLVKKALDGQVRILFDPELFTSGKGRLFHYCGDWEFLGGDPEMKDSRAAFVLELRKVLQPHFSKLTPRGLQKRLRESTPQRPKQELPQPAPPVPKKKTKDLPKLVVES